MDDDVKGLNPEERIARLKEMQEAKKKEIEEAETLIAESFREIGEGEGIRTGKIPQLEADDISSLLTAEEKSLFITSRFLVPGAEDAEGETAAIAKPEQRSLEETAAEEAKSEAARKGGKFKGYGSIVEEAKAKQDPMEAYHSRKSVTKANGDDREEAYQSQSVTRAEKQEQRDVYESSRSVTGMTYASQEKQAEEKTKGMYR